MVLLFCTLGSCLMPSINKPPFDPKEFLSRLDGARTVATYKKGEVVYRQGEAAEALFYLQAGAAKLTVISDQGKEALVGLLHPGDFFGEGAIGGQLIRLASVTTLQDSVVTCFPKAAIMRAVHDDPSFSEVFISHLLARNIRIEADLVDQLFNSSERRLARTLLLLANFGKDTPPEPVLAQISQETLAGMIGTTRSRVSYFMNKFRKLGLIDYNGHIQVHPALLNVVLHEVPHIESE